MSLIQEEESVQVKLKQIISFSLDHYLYDNAIFFAERLKASIPPSSAQSLSEEANLILAQCFYRQRNFKRAYSILEDSFLPACRFLFARCCYDLQKYAEGESVLLALLENKDFSSKGNLPGSSNSSLFRENEPDQSAICCLLGKLCKRTNRISQATTYLRQALQLNPMLWEAYEELCGHDKGLNPNEIFCCENVSSFYPWAALEPLYESSRMISSAKSSSPSLNSANTMTGSESNSNLENQPANNSSSISSPLHNASHSSARISSSTSSTNAIKRKEEMKPPRKKQRLFPSDNYSDGTPVRRSNRLNSVGSLSPSVATKKRNRPISSLDIHPRNSSIEDLGLKLMEMDTSSYGNQNQNELEILNTKALNIIFSVILCCANGYNNLCKFKCKKSIEEFSSLPTSHFNTGWVLSCVGRAYFELVDYRMAESIFEKLRSLEKHRFQGLEIYSTLLWHLQKDSSLSFLAHELVDFDKNSPQTWVTVGNCFSLQKDHESALKCFQRAIQLDQNFTYAYTLSGHEHVSNEDFEKAATCFRNAIRVDNRHYNAWYGLGMIFYRQEKYDLAEFHFKKAIDINSSSSVLYCYLAMVMHSNKRFKEALGVFEIAEQVDPNNPLVKFKKAKLLYSIDRFDAALVELEILKEITPKESSVYYLMGQIYKKMGDRQKAMIHFTWAYDLDPKGSTIIKEAMGNNDRFDDSEDVSSMLIATE